MILKCTLLTRRLSGLNNWWFTVLRSLHRVWCSECEMNSILTIRSSFSLYSIVLARSLVLWQWKKRSERRKHCALASCKTDSKIFAPPQTPFPGARDGQNSISWRWSLPLPTNPVWWRSMHAISSYRGNRPTNKHTNAATNPQIRRQDRLQYTAPLSLARSVNIY